MNGESGNIFRGILAILAGFLATAILSIGTDAALHASGVFPPMGHPMSGALFVLATTYRIVYTIFGGYITARLAPSKPMKYVMILGIIGVLAAVAGTVATWDKGPEFGPKWYPIALVVTALPCVLLGGRLRTQQLAPPTSGSLP